jgi:hypothetical protein
MKTMTDLDKAQIELETILDKIPVSGSFESARLAKKASELADKITELCSHPEAPETSDSVPVPQSSK